jgi:hypothetical protein
MSTTSKQICNQAAIDNDQNIQALFAQLHAQTADRVTGEQAAAILDLSLRQFLRYEKGGVKVSRKKIGKQLYYSRSEIVALKDRLPKKWTRGRLSTMS